MNIDTIAQALWQAIRPGKSLVKRPSWDDSDDQTKDFYRDLARAAIDSLQLTEFTCGDDRWWSTPIEDICGECVDHVDTRVQEKP